jgi:hypothetical protein
MERIEEGREGKRGKGKKEKKGNNFEIHEQKT